ncbi:MAG: sulfotransferase family protein [Roseiarcus sp.]
MALPSELIEDVRDMHPFIPYANFVYSIHISLKYNYIYVETPKCACSTIKTTLQRYELGDPTFYRQQFEDIHLREFSPLLNPRQVPSFRRLAADSRFFKFCVARHPATRLLSAYLDKIERNRPMKAGVLRQLGLPEIPLTTPVSFADFVHAVCEQPITMMDPHWRVQYYQTFQTAIQYDLIGKLEDLPAVIDRVTAALGEGFRECFTEELRHKTDASSLHDKYMTMELLDEIYEKYRIDFEYFGYTKTSIPA